MATEVRDLAVHADSNTLRSEEERLRAMLATRLGIHTRFTALPGTRAFLISPLSAGHPKGLVVDRSVDAAERISLYVHVAAHIALKHDLPLVTIVESRASPTSGDANGHRDADQLARAMWWGTAARADLREVWPGRHSRVLRPILASRPGRQGWACASCCSYCAGCTTPSALGGCSRGRSSHARLATRCASRRSSVPPRSS
jgi:hypothetical protein